MTCITAIIRIHSVECCTYLKRALLSVVGQSIDAEVLLACQNLSKDDFEYVRAFAAPYKFGSVHTISSLNIIGESGADIRSRLLNEGVLAANTRYIHFLDYDDILYPNAFELLTSALKRTSAVITFGGITSTFYETIGRAPFITHKLREIAGKSRYDLYVGNFCPLHSFVIDTTRCDRADIHFDESMSALEDYNFLLQFVAKHKADFSQINNIVGEYFRREADTVKLAETDYPDTSIRLSRLEAAREIIDRRKREISTLVRLSEFAWIMRPPEPWQPPPVEHNEKADDQADERRRQLDILKSKCLYASCDSNLEGSIGRIETFVFSDYKFEISGWFDDTHFNGDPVSLLLVTADGAIVAEPVRFDRQDVREYFSSDFQQFGFYFEFPAEDDGKYTADDFKVIAALLESGNVNCVAKYLT